MAAVTNIFNSLSRLAHAVISLKGLVLLSAVALLAFGDVRPSLLKQWDSQLVQWAQRLSPPRDVKSPFAFIEIDQPTLAELRDDPVASPLLPLLLQDNLSVLLLQEPIREQSLFAERVISKLNSPEGESIQQWQQAQSQYQAFRRQMDHGEILVGLTASGVASFPDQSLAVSSSNRLGESVWGLLPQPYGDKLSAWMNEQFRFNGVPWPVNPQLKAAAYRALAVAESGEPHGLIWQQEGRFHSDVVLSLFLRNLSENLKADAKAKVFFRDGYGVEVAHRWLPLSSDGSVVPATLQQPLLKHVSLNQALQNPPAEPIWLLGNSAQQAGAVANSFLALQSGQYFYTPYWAPAVQVVLLVIFGVYVLCLQPLLRLSMAAMMLVFIVASLTIAQMVWQLSFQQVLPLMLVGQWFAVASVLMMLWKQRKRQLMQLQWAHHNRAYELAQLCYQQGNLDQSLTTLQDCKSTQSVLALLYDIAVQQERKRNYQQAADTYEILLQRKPKYKDAQKRAEALRKVSEPAQVVTDFAATHSLVMPSQEFSNPVLGRYEIQRELGRGAMGVVYLGVDPKISRQVAIKTLSYREFDHDQLEPIKQRFFREAEAAGRLNHPNIVTVYDVGEEEDLGFIAMDFVEGTSLDRCVSQSSLLSIQEVYVIAAAVADALHYAHKQQIVHRDIKPANILYDEESGQIKVADFGIARIVDDSKTKTGDMLGSPVYMSPEQLKGTKVSGASDIYSLGVTLYQLLTGVLPYNGDSIANLAYLILNKKYKSVREVRPELSAGIVRIVNKAMHKEPSKRYDNAGQMADAIRGLLSREFGKKAS